MGVRPRLTGSPSRVPPESPRGSEEGSLVAREPSAARTSWAGPRQRELDVDSSADGAAVAPGAGGGGSGGLELAG